MWKRINAPTFYMVNFDTSELVQNVIMAIDKFLSVTDVRVVAQEARESCKKAADTHFEQVRRNIAAHKRQWSERINSIING